MRWQVDRLTLPVVHYLLENEQLPNICAWVFHCPKHLSAVDSCSSDPWKDINCSTNFAILDAPALETLISMSGILRMGMYVGMYGPSRASKVETGFSSLESEKR